MGIDHNLFDFDPASDGENLISSFGNVPARGPAIFHHNLVTNPGRGVMWMNEPYAQLEVRNNQIIARTTKTPRTEGLFGFNEKSEFTTFRFTGSLIECIGTAHYANKPTGTPAGLEQSLKFECGANGVLTVDGWTTSKTPTK